jgi:deoxyadenosine/deoxycytidine kinase
MSRVIVIDGNIGSGKTTFIKDCLIPFFNTIGEKTCVVWEPVNSWKESGRLKMFYEDPERRAFQFQVMAFHDRITATRKVINENPDASVIILDRSIFSDIFFMKALIKLGRIDRTEYEDYMSIWEMWTELMPVVPTEIIYLHPSLSTNLKRISKRDRSEEKGVDHVYLQTLEDIHDNFYNGESRVINGKRTKVTILNTNQEVGTINLSWLSS